LPEVHEPGEFFRAWRSKQQITVLHTKDKKDKGQAFYAITVLLSRHYIFLRPFAFAGVETCYLGEHNK
jgi:hypothetical protein